MEYCIFCNVNDEKIIDQSENFIFVFDNYPINEGHLLIISRKHINDFFDLRVEERFELNENISKAKRIIEKRFPKPDGYNIGMNCGEAAGQTIMHFHCHVIPRYKGDMEDPRGGVRNVIPAKGNYKIAAKFNFIKN